MVIAPPETLTDGVVVIEDHDDDTSTITVRDKVTKMSGQGRVGSKRADIRG